MYARHEKLVFIRNYGVSVRQMWQAMYGVELNECLHSMQLMQVHVPTWVKKIAAKPRNYAKKSVIILPKHTVFNTLYLLVQSV